MEWPIHNSGKKLFRFLVFFWFFEVIWFYLLYFILLVLQQIIYLFQKAFNLLNKNIKFNCKDTKKL